MASRQVVGNTVLCPRIWVWTGDLLLGRISQEISRTTHRQWTAAPTQRAAVYTHSRQEGESPSVGTVVKPGPQVGGAGGWAVEP